MIPDTRPRAPGPAPELNGLLGRVEAGVQPSVSAGWVPRPSGSFVLPEDWKQQARHVPRANDDPDSATVEKFIAAQAGRWASDRGVAALPQL